jgi:hypothetical protein
MRLLVLLWTVPLLGFVPTVAAAQTLPPLPQPKPPVLNPVPGGDIDLGGGTTEGSPPGGPSDSTTSDNGKTTVIVQKEEISQDRLNQSMQTGSQFIAIGFLSFFGDALTDINKHLRDGVGDMLHSPKSLMNAIQVDDLYKDEVWLGVKMEGAVVLGLALWYIIGPIIGWVDKDTAFRWLKFWGKSFILVIGVGIAISLAMQFSDWIVDQILTFTKFGSSDAFFSTQVKTPGLGGDGKGTFVVQIMTLLANSVCLGMLFLITIGLVIAKLVAPPLMVGNIFERTRWAPILWASVFGVILIQKPILALIFSIGDKILAHFNEIHDDFNAMGVIIIVMILAVIVPGLVLYFGLQWAIRNAIPSLLIGEIRRLINETLEKIPSRTRTGPETSPAL